LQLLKAKGIISNTQKATIAKLSQIPFWENFYLTGDTALAEFYLGHRRSYDLDFLTTDKTLILPLSMGIEEEFKKSTQFNIKVIHRLENYADFEISYKDISIRLHIGCDLPVRFGKPIPSNIGIKVNDYKDLMVDKLSAFFRRGEARDVVDLYFILKEENFWEITRLASLKDAGFDLYWLAVGLANVEMLPTNIDEWQVELFIDVKPEDVINIFTSLSKEVMKKIKEAKKNE